MVLIVAPTLFGANYQVKFSFNTPQTNNLISHKIIGSLLSLFRKGEKLRQTAPLSLCTPRFSYPPQLCSLSFIVTAQVNQGLRDTGIWPVDTGCCHICAIHLFMSCYLIWTSAQPFFSFWSAVVPFFFVLFFVPLLPLSFQFPFLSLALPAYPCSIFFSSLTPFLSLKRSFFKKTGFVFLVACLDPSVCV